MDTSSTNEALGTAPSAAAPLETPLATKHAAAGAKMGVWFGCALPDDFGDSMAEYRYAQQSVALIDKNYRAYLTLTGADRVRYLNAILTNNIKDLGMGYGIASLLLNPQGHILAEIEAYNLGEKLFCVSYAMIRSKLVEWLDKYIIMDDVTLADETERFGTLALEGPQAAAVTREVCGVDITALDELGSADGVAGKIECRIVKRPLGGAQGAEFVAQRERMVELWELLLESARKHGGGPAGYTAISGRRLAQGVPWFGYDFGEKQIPHEAGLENSHISYTKGCYTGQEIVERVRSRGQVNRRRVDLIFSGDTVPSAGAELTHEGKEMGYVTRAARIPTAGTGAPARVIGMGYVRKEANAPGSTLHWANGIATVSHFPQAVGPAG